MTSAGTSTDRLDLPTSGVGSADNVWAGSRYGQLQGGADDPVIAVVVPCFRVKQHISGVIDRIGPEVSLIYVIDDACPEQTGTYVEETITDPRVRVLFHETNKGVGGAVVTGYRQALLDGASIIVKIDGDGQMEPALLPKFVRPLLTGQADYTSGNRFYYPEDVRDMPRVRLIGNAILSFFSKVSTGYWDVFDPTNGYTAIDSRVLAALPLDEIDQRYFFESDMLFRLNTLRAAVVDIPMRAQYADEKSNLKISNIIWPFLKGYSRNLVKRIFYNYYLRDFSIASVELILGVSLFLFGMGFGISEWAQSVATDKTASAGTVMLSALPVIIGFQLLLSFLNYDMRSVPKLPISPRL
jgi:glycosyltransferase involved in cell wall biosynthesis